MADYESTGNALKKLVKMGRKNPMPFAFCPGSGDEAIFATHLKKSPEIISKAARKDSGQNKVAFGTYTLEGKLLILTMVKELPAVAKKLKKHLRGEGLNLNIKVLDASGQELEADIEDLPDEGEEADDADENDSAATEPDAPTRREAEETPPEDSVASQPADLTPLIARVKALQPGIMALPGDPGDKLRAALAQVLALIKAQKSDQAATTLNAVERAYERLSAGPSAAAEPEPDAEEYTPANAPTAPDEAEVAAQTRRLAGLMATAQTLAEPVRGKIIGALQMIGQQLSAGSVVKAASAMDPIEKTMARMAAQPAATRPEPSPQAGSPQAGSPQDAVSQADARAASPEQSLDAVPGSAPESLHADAEPDGADATTETPAAQVPDAKTTAAALAEKWAEAAAMLEPAVLAAIAARKVDANAIRLKFYGMQDQAETGNFKAALAQVGDLTAKLREVQADAPVGFDEIPADIVPFAKSLLVWSNTRSKLRSEVTRLKNAMDTALGQVEGMESAIGETAKLFTYIEKLDNRLEKVLDKLTNTPDGPERQTLKSEARDIVAQYSTELDGEFFRDADGDNGFAQVSLRGPAVSALQRISAVLAA
tara:strand:+ start:10452 stop:12245 length:1794 start_codon:yes stop_codon:yes gene_type:complete